MLFNFLIRQTLNCYFSVFPIISLTRYINVQNSAARLKQDEMIYFLNLQTKISVLLEDFGIILSQL